MPLRSAGANSVLGVIENKTGLVVGRTRAPSTRQLPVPSVSSTAERELDADRPDMRTLRVVQAVSSTISYLTIEVSPSSTAVAARPASSTPLSRTDRSACSPVTTNKTEHLPDFSGALISCQANDYSAFRN
jgi:hypothetical protein